MTPSQQLCVCDATDLPPDRTGRPTGRVLSHPGVGSAGPTERRDGATERRDGTDRVARPTGGRGDGLKSGD